MIDRAKVIYAPKVISKTISKVVTEAKMTGTKMVYPFHEAKVIFVLRVIGEVKVAAEAKLLVGAKLLIGLPVLC